MIPPYPLKWPQGKARSRSFASSYKFQRTLSAAHKICTEEFDKMRVSPIITTNMLGFNSKAPDDKGVCAWFEYKGVLRSIAIDCYDSVRGNMCGLAMTLESLRTLERHGGVSIFDQAMQGFASALPERTETAIGSRNWWDVLGVAENTPLDVVEAVYKALVKKHHPDLPGGSDRKMAEINDAYSEAKKR